jgi:RNA polymerase sigma-70 factor (ECF subfamily)
MLLTQAHGLSVDVIRSETARRRREEKAGLEPAAPLPAVDTELMAVTAADQVRTALASLPPDERVAIELAYFGANTYRQVAELLGAPEGTIKARIRTGLRRLHTVLRDDDTTSPKAVARTTNMDRTTSNDGKDQS